MECWSVSHTDCTEGTEEEPNSALLLESLKQQIQQVQRIQPMGQNLLEV